MAASRSDSRSLCFLRVAAELSQFLGVDAARTIHRTSARIPNSRTTTDRPGDATVVNEEAHKPSSQTSYSL